MRCCIGGFKFTFPVTWSKSESWGIWGHIMDGKTKSSALDEHKRLAAVVKSTHANLRKKLRESKKRCFIDLLRLRRLTIVVTINFFDLSVAQMC